MTRMETSIPQTGYVIVRRSYLKIFNAQRMVLIKRARKLAPQPAKGQGGRMVPAIIQGDGIKVPLLIWPRADQAYVLALLVRRQQRAQSFARRQQFRERGLAGLLLE